MQHSQKSKIKDNSSRPNSTEVVSLASKVTAALVSLAYIVPDGAAAHGLFDRADLPIPQWLFGWAAAVVLVVSFVALGALWSKPKLTEDKWNPLPKPINHALNSLALKAIFGAVGTLLLAVVLYSGFYGIQAPEHNFAPTFVYVVFLVGLVPVSVIFGDVFRAINPWGATAKAAVYLLSTVRRKPVKAAFSYPERFGYWPAAAGLIAFATLELIVYGGSRPESIAIATVVYSLFTYIGMALFGIEAWLDRGEAFSVYFNLFSRISIIERRGSIVGVRPPLSGLAGMPRVTGLTFMLAVMIGTVTYDGAGEGPLGLFAIPKLQKLSESIGLSTVEATQIALGLSLFIVVILMLGFYRLGIAGIRSSSNILSMRRLAREFAPTLVPIALAYVGAHYMTLLLYQGQAIFHLSSDPLGNGSDLLGTAGTAVNHGIMGATTAWYLQIGLIVTGHVSALVLAHDRALVLFGKARSALVSQCWMLAVMVGFTVLALWLLSQANL